MGDRAIRRLRRASLALLVLALVGWVGLATVARLVARHLNAVRSRSVPALAPSQRAAYQALTIADLHADPLLWSRDLDARASWGHLDVPRLLEANVALQVFGVVTQTPRHLNVDRNDGSTDDITLLAMGEGWPPSTWFSLRARALYQARRLAEMAHASGGKLVLVRSRADLAELLAQRQKDRGHVGALLALEGMQALEGDPANVDVLYDAGFRILGPAHFFDNQMAGSAHGVEKYGLTEKGREVLRRMEARHMIVDLAHSSPRTIDDVLALATRPVIVSHTGVKATCDNARNLSDAQLRAVAKNGGLVGIGYFPLAVCGTDAQAIARAVKHAVDVAGADHVALGSDFDGAVTTPFDVTGLPALYAALRAQGLSDAQLSGVMGGNAARFFAADLP